MYVNVFSNMKKDNRINEFVKSLDQLKESVESGKITETSALFDRVQGLYETLRTEGRLYHIMEGFNFAALNHLLEENLSGLAMKDKNAVGRILMTIKKDKNLLEQARFFNAMSEYNGSCDAKEYLNECLGMMSEKLDAKTIAESNRNLANVMYENGIKVTDFTEELAEANKFGQSCGYLITNRKKFSNINEMAAQANAAAEYLSNHKKEDNVQTVYEECDMLNKSMEKLNEAEKSLVQDIIDAKAKGAELKQRNIFDKYRNECIKYINAMIAEGKDVDKLTGLKEQILAKEFDKDHIVEDIAKFLEIGSILSN